MVVGASTMEPPVTDIPDIRIRAANDRPPRTDGEFVLYWMIAARRTTWNFALQRAAWWAKKLGRPLVVLEALRCDYPWASDRLHRFILEGMEANRRSLEGGPVFYYPFVETRKGEGKGLLEALGRRACLVVTDDFPAFFLPRMVAAAAGKLPVLLEAVDGNGQLPLRAADRAFTTAYSFRRFLQKELPGHLLTPPLADPLKGLTLPPLDALPEEVARRWPPPPARLLQGCRSELAKLPIDHDVPPAPLGGGEQAAKKTLARFLSEGLPRYAEERNRPEAAGATSGLSPFLHFGHISTHEIFALLARQEGWSPGHLGPETRGKRTGWWGMGESAEAFLDQLVTWRELGFNGCAFREDYDRYDSLPPWALATLEKHASDLRPTHYSLDEFAAAATHDPLWNAIQRQLLREGTIHGYLRMLWGKKILEWSPSPREALSTMVELNNRYALDGRDPNSWSGIFWCLGRYDRAWGPERPIFGTVRYMSSENTARKVSVKNYLRRYGP